MNMRLLYIFLFGGIATVASSMKVLIAVPGIIKSLHGVLGHISLLLAEAGHNVTFVTNYDLMEGHALLEVIPVKSCQYVNEINVFDLRDVSVLTKKFADITTEYVHCTWKAPETMEVWKRRNSFDVFLTLSYFCEHTFPFLEDFEGHFVQLVTPGIDPQSLSREGNWLPPSTVPSLLSKSPNKMNFWERNNNLFSTLSSYGLGYASKNRLEDLQEYFPQMKDFDSYYDRVAMTFINGHYALDGPVPLLPSQILVGPLLTREPKPLPKDLEAFMQSSGEHGIIYFNLGTIAKSTDMPNFIKEAFAKAFAQIPHKVLWKYEGTDIELPDNVMTTKWVPQQDVLGHPKTKVFISHCGNLGTQESKYHGVPTLGLPIAFDQPRNCERMSRMGLAIVLEWEDLTPEAIIKGIYELIENKGYKERITSLSRLLKDQKEDPGARLVWWLEYLVRHNGVPQLRYSGADLSIFQYLMLDVLLMWLMVFVVFVVSTVMLCRRCCRKGKSKKLKKN